MVFNGKKHDQQRKILQRTLKSVPFQAGFLLGCIMQLSKIQPWRVNLSCSDKSQVSPKSRRPYFHIPEILQHSPCRPSLGAECPGPTPGTGHMGRRGHSPMTHLPVKHIEVPIINLCQVLFPEYQVEEQRGSCKHSLEASGSLP